MSFTTWMMNVLEFGVSVTLPAVLTRDLFVPEYRRKVAGHARKKILVPAKQYLRI